MTRPQAILQSMFLGSTMCFFLALLSLYLISTTVYRLFFHPLAKFPGPKLAAATKWYEFYFDIIKRSGGQSFKSLAVCMMICDTLGPIVCPNPDEIHIRDPAWFDVLYAPNPTKRNKYPPAAEMAGVPLETHGTVDHDLHRRRRIAKSPLFSKRAVASTQDLIHEHIKELARVFEARVGKDEPLDLQTTFLAYATDVVYHYMFDMDTGYQRDPEAAKRWKHSMKAAAQATLLLKQLPSLIGKLLLLPDPVLQWILSRTLPDVAGLLGTHKCHWFGPAHGKVVAKYVVKKATDPEVEGQDDAGNKIKPKTLFHAIDKSNLPPNEKSPLRLKQEGLTVLFAGGETGSTLLSHTMYHLLANPKVLEKVKEEILEAAGDSKEWPDIKVLEGLPWLAASVRESLRLRAATMSRLPLVSEKEFIYETWTIPAGTAVSMSHPDVLHNEVLFLEPTRFRPERWFNVTDQQNRCFVPFGKGTRMCISIEFAYGEMYMSLATILCRFDLQLFETSWRRDVSYTRECFLDESDRASPGIRVRVVADNRKFTS